MKVGRSPGSFFGNPGHQKNSQNCVTVIIFQVLGTSKTNTKKERKKVVQAMRARMSRAPCDPLKNFKNPGNE